MIVWVIANDAIMRSALTIGNVEGEDVGLQAPLET